MRTTRDRVAEHNQLYQRAVAFVRSSGKPYGAFLEKELKISWADTQPLLARMEKEGVITPPGPAPFLLRKVIPEERLEKVLTEHGRALRMPVPGTIAVPAHMQEVAREIVQEEIDLLVWDLETTGFVAPACKILEIGAFLVYGDQVVKKHWVLDNKCEIPEEAAVVHGITLDIIAAEGRDPKECLNEFLPLFKRAKRHVTHNGFSFDIPFLVNYAEDLLGWTYKQRDAVKTMLRSTGYDTAVLVKSAKLRDPIRANEPFHAFADRIMCQRVKGLKFNLGDSCDEAGIDRSKVVQHRAMGDVELTHLLYKHLTK